jgi:hypothetical protein
MAGLINTTRALNSLCKIFSSMSVTSAVRSKCLGRYGYVTVWYFLWVRL